MMGIVLSYLVAILLLGIGIITLVYSDKIAGDLYVDEEVLICSSRDKDS
jgi:hypothetical protein